jgi:hypothetical protein
VRKSETISECYAVNPDRIHPTLTELVERKSDAVLDDVTASLSLATSDITDIFAVIVKKSRPKGLRIEVNAEIVTYEPRRKNARSRLKPLLQTRGRALLRTSA